MTKLIRATFFVFAALAVCAVEARANSVTIGGLTDPLCATCQGSTYMLTISDTPLLVDPFPGGLLDTYRVTLTINTSGYTGGGKYIDEVAVKVSSGVDNVKLVDAPRADGLTGGASLWSIVPGGLNADGCSGSGSGFECADWIGAGGKTYVIPGATLTWVFDVDISGSVFDLASIDPNLLPSIKARYVDVNGNKVGALVSEKVPEPATLALLGVGMSLAAFRRRRAQR